MTTPKDVPDASKWRWRMLIRILDGVTQDQVEDAQQTTLNNRGVDTSDLKCITWEEGSSLQLIPDRIASLLQAGVADSPGCIPGASLRLKDKRLTTMGTEFKSRVTCYEQVQNRNLCVDGRIAGLETEARRWWPRFGPSTGA